MQVPAGCTDLDASLFYILITRTCARFARNNNFLALGVLSPTGIERWQHVCRVKITFKLLQTTGNWSVCTKTNSMKCLVNWLQLRIRVRSRNTQLEPHLKLTSSVMWSERGTIIPAVVGSILAKNQTSRNQIYIDLNYIDS